MVPNDLKARNVSLRERERGDSLKPREIFDLCEFPLVKFNRGLWFSEPQLADYANNLRSSFADIAKLLKNGQRGNSPIPMIFRCLEGDIYETIHIISQDARVWNAPLVACLKKNPEQKLLWFILQPRRESEAWRLVKKYRQLTNDPLATWSSLFWADCAQRLSQGPWDLARPSLVTEPNLFGYGTGLKGLYNPRTNKYRSALRRIVPEVEPQIEILDLPLLPYAWNPQTYPLKNVHE